MINTVRQLSTVIMTGLVDSMKTLGNPLVSTTYSEIKGVSAENLLRLEDGSQYRVTIEKIS